MKWAVRPFNLYRRDKTCLEADKLCLEVKKFKKSAAAPVPALSSGASGERAGVRGSLGLRGPLHTLWSLVPLLMVRPVRLPVRLGPRPARSVIRGFQSLRCFAIFAVSPRCVSALNPSCSSSHSLLGSGLYCRHVPLPYMELTNPVRWLTDRDLFLKIF